jgi:lysophospholipase L1-like esterase
MMLGDELRMKNILCYGDSLTWGYDAEALGPASVRGALAERASGRTLADGVHVVEDGLNGRTTAFDDQSGSRGPQWRKRTLPTSLMPRIRRSIWSSSCSARTT